MREDYYQEYFEVEDRHWFFVARRRILLALLESHVGLAPDGSQRRLIDFGCGPGAILGELQRFGEVEAVDVDERAIEFCRRRGFENLTLLEGDHLPFPDSSFSIATSLDVFEHIEDDLGAMRELARVLEPGGSLLAAVPAHPWMWGPQDEVSGHVRRYTARGLRSRLEDAGFSIERMTYFNTWLFPPIALTRLIRRLLPSRGEPRSDLQMTKEGPLNSLLTHVFGSEARWLRRHDLPFGVSLAALARRDARP